MTGQIVAVEVCQDRHFPAPKIPFDLFRYYNAHVLNRHSRYPAGTAVRRQKFAVSDLNPEVIISGKRVLAITSLSDEQIRILAALDLLQSGY